ncbi:hypothetical protein, partial [Phyllobacterium salinisoli]|uniref:hypothetical protein n=1 Tax=Phyllobacterium salinisoli TaxID=1899321 RepID=UPI0011C0536A
MTNGTGKPTTPSQTPDRAAAGAVLSADNGQTYFAYLRTADGQYYLQYDPSNNSVHKITQTPDANCIFTIVPYQALWTIQAPNGQYIYGGAVLDDGYLYPQLSTVSLQSYFINFDSSGGNLANIFMPGLGDQGGPNLLILTSSPFPGYDPGAWFNWNISQQIMITPVENPKGVITISSPQGNTLTCGNSYPLNGNYVHASGGAPFQQADIVWS